ncbi:hypothetical protein LXL04_006570 [Taraxacum kok-saghyz]
MAYKIMIKKSKDKPQKVVQVIRALANLGHVGFNIQGRKKGRKSLERRQEERAGRSRATAKSASRSSQSMRKTIGVAGHAHAEEDRYTAEEELGTRLLELGGAEEDGKRRRSVELPKRKTGRLIASLGRNGGYFWFLAVLITQYLLLTALVSTRYLLRPAASSTRYLLLTAASSTVADSDKLSTSTASSSFELSTSTCIFTAASWSFSQPRMEGSHKTVDEAESRSKELVNLPIEIGKWVKNTKPTGSNPKPTVSNPNPSVRGFNPQTRETEFRTQETEPAHKPNSLGSKTQKPTLAGWVRNINAGNFIKIISIVSTFNIMTKSLQLNLHGHHIYTAYFTLLSQIPQNLFITQQQILHIIQKSCFNTNQV